jgi:hypothetical protein
VISRHGGYKRWLYSLAAIAISVLTVSCSEKSTPSLDIEQWNSWKQGDDRLDLADSAMAAAKGKAASDVVRLLGQGIGPADQNGFEGCPPCLVYSLRPNGFGDDYLVLPLNDGIVGRGFVQWRRFN